MALHMIATLVGLGPVLAGIDFNAVGDERLGLGVRAGAHSFTWYFFDIRRRLGFHVARHVDGPRVTKASARIASLEK